MSVMYNKLPNELVKEIAGAESEGVEQMDDRSEAENFFKEIIPADMCPEDLKTTALQLSKWKVDKERVSAVTKRTLNYKEKRRLNLHKIKENNLKYEDFIPMHNMWLSYIKDVLGLKKSPENIESILLKADYHGCRLLVSRAKNQSLVGITGIVIKENKNTFFCITRENKIKVLPKQNSVFNFHFGNHLFTLYGNHFRIKTTDRKAKNFKSKATIDL